MSDLATELVSLIDEDPAIHIWNFFLQDFETEAWTLYETLPAYKQADLSVDILLMEHKQDPNLYMRYELYEAASNLAADRSARSLAAEHMVAGRLRELGKEDKDHPSDLVQGARLAFVDDHEEGFHSLILAYANLAYRLQSIGEQEVEIDELAKLKPNLFFREALSGEEQNGIEVRISVPSPQFSPGEIIPIKVEQITHPSSSLWYLFLSDTDRGRFIRKQGQVTFVPPKQDPPAEINLYVAWFDAQLRKGIASLKLTHP